MATKLVHFFLVSVMTMSLSFFSSVFAESPYSGSIHHVDFESNPNVKSWARGRYVYLDIASGEWRGEEEWTVTENSDGSRTMRMFTLLAATDLMRDFIHRVDEDFSPIESFQSTWRKGERTGSGMYIFTEGEVEALVHSPNGVFTQKVRIEGPVTMIPHSMAGDGWHFGSYDREKGGVQKITAYNPSGWGDGIQSVLSRVHEVDIELKGQETVSVPAGTFDCDVWYIGKNDNGDWVNEVWVFGKHSIMVQFVDHQSQLIYQLDRYSSS